MNGITLNAWGRKRHEELFKFSFLLWRQSQCFVLIGNCISYVRIIYVFVFHLITYKWDMFMSGYILWDSSKVFMSFHSLLLLLTTAATTDYCCYYWHCTVNLIKFLLRADIVLGILLSYHINSDKHFRWRNWSLDY